MLDYLPSNVNICALAALVPLPKVIYYHFNCRNYLDKIRHSYIVPEFDPTSIAYS